MTDDSLRQPTAYPGPLLPDDCSWTRGLTAATHHSGVVHDIDWARSHPFPARGVSERAAGAEVTYTERTRKLLALLAPDPTYPRIDREYVRAMLAEAWDLGAEAGPRLNPFSADDPWPGRPGGGDR
jgi:hypothetical protein